MKKVALWMTLVLASVLFWNQLSSSEKPNTTPREEQNSSPLETAVPASADPVLNDILQIREATGSALRGSVLEKITGNENKSQQGFEQALQRLANEEAVRREAQDLVPVEQSLEQSPPAPTLPFVSTLRQASRLLDERAHDFESERDFAAARRLRKLAAQLLREARAADSN